VRSLKPGVHIAVGRYDPSMAPDRYTETSTRAVDFIVRGEGEITFRELLRPLERGGGYDRIRGLSYREGDLFRHNPARPVNGLESQDIRVLSGYTMLGRQIDVVETSRGCTFDCSFCSIIAMPGRQFHS
jgi:anaerobic magnesium-protoporphyrin IX monomethyl ester cyclase